MHTTLHLLAYNLHLIGIFAYINLLDQGWHFLPAKISKKRFCHGSGGKMVTTMP